MFDDDLKEQVIASQYRRLETKAEIVEAYQESYPGKGKGGRGLAWKQALVSDVLRVQGHTPENTDPKEYKRLTKNIGKRFESRLASPEPKNKEEYKTIGQTLPPVPPEEVNYTVRVTGEIRISQWCRPVDFKIAISSAYQDAGFSLLGSNATAFTEEPNVYDLVIAYWQGDDPGYSGWCSGPNITIEA